jgi:integrase
MTGRFRPCRPDKRGPERLSVATRNTTRHHGKPLINPHKPWARLCRQAEFEGVRLHDLRHTYASTGAALGLSLPILGKLLGHQQAATTQRYAHLAPNPVHEAAHRVSARLREALGS